MKVASSGSVDGTRVVVEYIDEEGDGDEEDESCIEAVDVADVVLVVVVVEDAVNRSFSSAAKRTMSFALTIRASKSFSAFLMSVAVFWAEVSTVLMIPSGYNSSEYS